jgi:hybrid cluster-associated redox disulfide protein
MVTKDMIIGDILKESPLAARVMMKHGLHCIGCAVSTEESLEDGCKVHGLSDEQIDSMVDEINAIPEKEEE